jgi:hypothetical protein
VGPAVALLALLATAAACGVVLRDIAAYGRPPAPPKPPPSPRVIERVARVEPVTEPLVVVAQTEHVEHAGSMLAALGSVEHDEHSPLRRVGAAVMLLALTLLAAGAVGFGIYRGVSGLR